MKEQINEMAKVICKNYGDCSKCSLKNIDKDDTCSVYQDCEALYNAGYRKHRTGRWVHNEGGSAYQPPYFCSECLAYGDYDGDNPFCWNCGAKMKRSRK